MSVNRLFTGLEYLPVEIKDYLKRSMHSRPSYPHIYHVTELLYGLRKAYYRRKFPRGEMSVGSVWNMFRGKTFDGVFSPLFDVNQQTYLVHRGGCTIVGTLDFLMFEEHGGERVLCDLKMPASVFYKKKYGAGVSYHMQVQSYLAMAHVNGELTDISRCRVYMLAEDLVVDEVGGDDGILDAFLWPRVFDLDQSLTSNNPSNLKCPEEKWECNSRYCEVNNVFREKYCERDKE